MITSSCVSDGVQFEISSSVDSCRHEVQVTMNKAIVVNIVV